MLKHHRLFAVITVVLLVSAVSGTPLDRPGEASGEDLDARVITNQEGRQSLGEIGVTAFHSNSSEENEDDGTDYYFGRPAVFEYANENVSDYETADNQTQGVPSGRALFPTAEGVDTQDPEEIERRNYYGAKVDTFRQIVAINKFVNNSLYLEEGDMKKNPFRNAGGGAQWPKTNYGSNRGLVLIPFKISRQYNATHVSIIRSAMASYAKHTCVRFVQRRQEHAYISVHDRGGCWAFVGKTGYSAQTVSLGIPGCVTKGIALHELMHAVGFQHEHSRSDRDKYVKILHRNIQAGMDDNFDKHSYTQNLVVYDYGSVMHYSKHAFSKYPYVPSIQIYPKRKPEPEIGQRTRLSPYDIEEIKYLYNCEPGTYQRCGRDFPLRTSGAFKSPSYPNAYPKESHCSWNITVRPGKFINITFMNIDIFDSPLCQSDAVIIHDGRSAASPVLKRVCGTHSNEIHVASTGSHMFVIFSTNIHQQTHRGFRAIFREISSPGTRPSLPQVLPVGPIPATVSSFHCNFDHNMCGMTQDVLDDLDYSLQRGSTPSQDTGPSGDHTTGAGQYIFVESSLPAEIGDNAIIRTPWFKRDFKFCVKYSYHMFGSYMGGLRLYAFEKRRNDIYGHEVLLSETYGNQGRRWRTKTISYSPRTNVEHVQFYWEIFVHYYQSDIALDDIRVISGRCSDLNLATSPPPSVQVKTTSPKTAKTTTTTISTTTTPAFIPVFSSLNCSFDQGICDLSQSTDDNFDWIINSGNTPSASTGPSKDHTSGRGHYMYIEASSPRRQGHSARLESPLLTSTRHCLRMWYHMYGKQTGKLSIWQVINGIPTLLVERIGDSGNHWLPLSVDINSPNFKKSTLRRDHVGNDTLRVVIDANEQIEPEVILEVQNDDPGPGFTVSEAMSLLDPSPDLKVIIEATVGRGYAGDIAIDDVVITDSPCEEELTSRIAAVEVLHTNFSCDFEGGEKLCGLIQGQDDDFDWLPNSGSTGSSGTGPINDHTLKNRTGVYVYTESSSPRRVNDVAELLTPRMAPNQYCAKFAYHMHGSATGDLKFFALEELPGDIFLNPRLLWSESGPQGNAWSIASAEYLPSANIRSVQFILHGLIGTSFTSDMALDDIFITAGGCTGVPSIVLEKSTTTTPSQSTTTTQLPTTTTTATTTTTQPPTTTTTTTTTTQPPTTTTTTTTQPPTTTTTTTTQPPTTTTTTTTQPPTTTTTTTTQPPTTTTSTTTQPPTTTATTTTQPPTTTTTTTTTQPPTTTTTTATTQPPTTTTTTTQPPTTTTTTTTTQPPTTTATTTTQPPTTTTTTTTQPPTTTTTTTTTQPPTTTLPRSKSTTKSTTTASTTTRTTTARSIAPTSQYPSGFSCDFETPTLCSMRQSQTDAFDWIRRKNRTPSQNTGPTQDHTVSMNGRGHYMFIETSSPRQRYDGAILRSPKLSVQTRKRCVEFWYHMWGRGVGSLNVFADYSSPSRARKSSGPLTSANRVIFSERGNKGRQWLKARTEINQEDALFGGSVRISFQGIRGSSYLGDLAIDDVCITEGPCESFSKCGANGGSRSTTKPNKATTAPQSITRSSSTARTTTTTAAVTTTAPRRNEPALWSGMSLCTFENNRGRSFSRPSRTQSPPGNSSQDLGAYSYPSFITDNNLCGMRQVQSSRSPLDQFNWRRNSGSTPSKGTGPSRDKTTGQGNYMYIEASAPRKFNDAAFLQVYPMPPTDYCIDLNYHMYGKRIGRLTVRSLQRLSSGRSVSLVLSNIIGNKGDSWKNKKINYSPRTDTRFVAFRFDGRVGRGYQGDIAIDDIAILPGKCDACRKSSLRYVNNLNQRQKFATGCVNSSLFWVRCCSSTRERAIYRRVNRCSAGMFSPERLYWYCDNL